MYKRQGKKSARARVCVCVCAFLFSVCPSPLGCKAHSRKSRRQPPTPAPCFFVYVRVLVWFKFGGEQEAPYADGCSQIEILQTLKEHGGSGLLPLGTEDRPALSEAFVGFVADCLRVKPEVRCVCVCVFL